MQQSEKYYLTNKSNCIDQEKNLKVNINQCNTWENDTMPSMIINIIEKKTKLFGFTLGIKPYFYWITWLFCHVWLQIFDCAKSVLWTKIFRDET